MTTSHKIGIWGNTPSATENVGARKATEITPAPVVKKDTWVQRLFPSTKEKEQRKNMATNKQIEAGAKAILEHRSHVKRKRWGLRHAFIAFILGIIIQTLVTIPIIFAETVNQVNSGVPVDESTVVNAVLGSQNLFWLQLATYVGWFLGGIYASWRLGLHSLAKDFWFRIGARNKNIFTREGAFKAAKNIGLGLAIAVGVRLAETGLFLLFDALNLDMSGSDNGAVFMQGADDFWKYALLFGIVSFAGPIAEEFLFRGMLLQGLLRNFTRRSFVPKTWFGKTVDRYSPQLFNVFLGFKNFLYKHRYVLSVLISGAAFGIMHYQGVDTFGQIWVVVETGLIGVLFAVIALRQRSLGIVLAAHCFFNLSGVILSLSA